MTLEQIKTIGTILPSSQERVRHSVRHSERWNSVDMIRLDKPKKVFEVLTFLGEECLAIENPDYCYSHHFIIPISELIRIGIVGPESVLPDNWYVHNDGSQLFKDTVIKYLNNTFNKFYVGRYDYYGVNDKGLSDSSSRSESFGEDTVVLSIQDFIKLTPKKMNIAGYKILKPVPLTTFKVGSIIGTNSGCFEDCKNYPEFFEPQYEEEFKVGDWVIATGQNHTYNNDNFPTNIPWKILKFSNDSGKENYHIYVDKSSTSIKGQCTSINSIRKATTEEIEAAKTIEINGYKADYSERSHVKFGCKNFNKSDINSYLYLLSHVDDAKITIGSTQITTTILNKILNKIN